VGAARALISLEAPPSRARHAVATDFSSESERTLKIRETHETRRPGTKASFHAAFRNPRAPILNGHGIKSLHPPARLAIGHSPVVTFDPHRRSGGTASDTTGETR
jgi:hypothetical protein